MAVKSVVVNRSINGTYAYLVTDEDGTASAKGGMESACEAMNRAHDIVHLFEEMNAENPTPGNVVRV